MKRPDGCLDEHLIFLDNLRKSGVTNMYGASPYLLQAYPSMKDKDAWEILKYWMDTFGEGDR